MVGGFRKQSIVGDKKDTMKRKEDIIESFWRKAGATPQHKHESDICAKMLSAMLQKMLGRQAHKAYLKHDLRMVRISESPSRPHNRESRTPQERRPRASFQERASHMHPNSMHACRDDMQADDAPHLMTCDSELRYRLNARLLHTPCNASSVISALSTVASLHSKNEQTTKARKCRAQTRAITSLW